MFCLFLFGRGQRTFVTAVKVQERPVKLFTVSITGHIIGSTKRMSIMRCNDDLDLTFYGVKIQHKGGILGELPLDR